MLPQDVFRHSEVLKAHIYCPAGNKANWPVVLIYLQSHVLTLLLSLLLTSAPSSKRRFTFSRSPFLAAMCNEYSWWRERKH